jgi:hypothetical protein
MKPSEKSPELDEFIDQITPNLLGRRGSIESNICATCLKPIGKFKDKLSEKEYTISGMCQVCQDSIFG